MTRRRLQFRSRPKEWRRLFIQVINHCLFVTFLRLNLAIQTPGQRWIPAPASDILFKRLQEMRHYGKSNYHMDFGNMSHRLYGRARTFECGCQNQKRYVSQKVSFSNRAPAYALLKAEFTGNNKLI